MVVLLHLDLEGQRLQLVQGLRISEMHFTVIDAAAVNNISCIEDIRSSHFAGFRLFHSWDILSFVRVHASGSRGLAIGSTRAGRSVVGRDVDRDVLRLSINIDDDAGGGGRQAEGRS